MLEIIEQEFDENVISLKILTDEGEIEIIHAFERKGSVLYIMDLLVTGPGGKTLGYVKLRSLIRDFSNWAKERADVTEIVVQGSKRTTGAAPGRVPGPIKI